MTELNLETFLLTARSIYKKAGDKRDTHEEDGGQFEVLAAKENEQ